MAENVEPHGLCSTCRNACGCTYLQRARSPVLQCEEFDGYEPPRRAAGGRAAATAGPHFGSDTREGYSSGYKGLCSDCEDRASCIFPKPEGGVWHCEEYR